MIDHTKYYCMILCIKHTALSVANVIATMMTLQKAKSR